MEGSWKCAEQVIWCWCLWFAVVFSLVRTELWVNLEPFLEQFGKPPRDCHHWISPVNVVVYIFKKIINEKKCVRSFKHLTLSLCYWFSNRHRCGHWWHRHISSQRIESLNDFVLLVVGCIFNIIFHNSNLQLHSILQLTKYLKRHIFFPAAQEGRFCLHFTDEEVDWWSAQRTRTWA